MELKVGSLFSGIGGIVIDFQQADFCIKWSLKKYAACCRTLSTQI